MELVDVAQAVTAVSLGPCAPRILATWPVPMLAIIIGMKKGLTRPMPPSISRVCCSSSVAMPPMPLTDEDADAGAVRVGDVQAGVLHGHLGGGDGELDEAVHALGLFAVQIVVRVEALDLGGDARGDGGAVEIRDRLTPLRP